MLYSGAPDRHTRQGGAQLPDLAKFAEGNSAAPQGHSTAPVQAERFGQATLAGTHVSGRDVPGHEER